MKGYLELTAFLPQIRPISRHRCISGPDIKIFLKSYVMLAKHICRIGWDHLGKNIFNAKISHFYLNSGLDIDASVS